MSAPQSPLSIADGYTAHVDTFARDRPNLDRGPLIRAVDVFDRQNLSAGELCAELFRQLAAPAEPPARA